MEQNFLQHWISGFTAGFVATVVLHPLDLLKIRMQVIESNQFQMGHRNRAKTISQISRKAATTGTAIGNGAYNSMYTAMQLIVKQEGIMGLYRGLVPAVIASSGCWGGYFFFYEYFKQRNAQLYGSNSSRNCNSINSSSMNTAPQPLFNNSTIHWISGCQAGVCLVLIFNPLWMVKTRLTLQGVVPAARQYTGLINAFSTIFKEEGLMGFYKGIIPAMFLTSHGAIQFTVYEQLKIYGQNRNISINRYISFAPVSSADGSKSQSPTMSAMNGAFSKVIATVTTYPYQVIKSRLQQGDSLMPLIAAINNNNNNNNISVTNHNRSQPLSLASSSSSSSSCSPAAPLHHTHTQLYDTLLLRNSSSGSSNISGNIHKAVKYTGTMDCVKRIWKYEGIPGFFRGVVPCALRSAPSAGITLLVYEETLRFLRTQSI